MWKPDYNGFSFKRFYYFIVDYFERAEGRLAQTEVAALLAWWNMYVFKLAVYCFVVDVIYRCRQVFTGSNDMGAQCDDEDSDDLDSDMILERQHKAREERAAAQPEY